MRRMLTLFVTLLVAASVAAQEPGNVIDAMPAQESGNVIDAMPNPGPGTETPPNCIKVGPRGPQGPRGAKGDRGPQGPAAKGCNCGRYHSRRSSGGASRYRVSKTARTLSAYGIARVKRIESVVGVHGKYIHRLEAQGAKTANETVRAHGRIDSLEKEVAKLRKGEATESEKTEPKGKTEPETKPKEEEEEEEDSDKESEGGADPWAIPQGSNPVPAPADEDLSRKAGFRPVPGEGLEWAYAAFYPQGDNALQVTFVANEGDKDKEPEKPTTPKKIVIFAATNMGDADDPIWKGVPETRIIVAAKGDVQSSYTNAIGNAAFMLDSTKHYTVSVYGPNGYFADSPRFAVNWESGSEGIVRAELSSISSLAEKIGDIDTNAATAATNAITAALDSGKAASNSHAIRMKTGGNWEKYGNMASAVGIPIVVALLLILLLGPKWAAWRERRRYVNHDHE